MTFVSENDSARHSASGHTTTAPEAASHVSAEPGPYCASYLCDRAPTGPDRLCAACRATEALWRALSDALETFLNDQVPVTERNRADLFDAGGHLARALSILGRRVSGRSMFVTCGPWVDAWGDGRWHSGMGWDIAEGDAP